MIPAHSIIDAYDAATYNSDGSLKEQPHPCDAKKFVCAIVNGDECDGVYVVLNPDNGLCKIGISRDMKARMDNLQTACGSTLEMLLRLELEPGYDEPPGYIERWLHKAFINKRVRGEWFRLCVRDLVAIRNLFHRIYGLHLSEHDAWHDYNERKRLLSCMSHLHFKTPR